MESLVDVICEDSSVTPSLLVTPIASERGRERMHFFQIISKFPCYDLLNELAYSILQSDDSVPIDLCMIFVGLHQRKQITMEPFFPDRTILDTRVVLLGQRIHVFP